jgi:cilia- and flagella-associated protein 44
LFICSTVVYAHSISAVQASGTPSGTPEIPVEQVDAVEQLSEGQLEHSAARLSAAEHLVSKRNNILLAKPNLLVTSAGNSVILFDILTGARTYALGRDGGGIGAIAVHPTQPLLAVAEQCKLRAPNVYIYKLSDTSDLQLEYVLKAGTEHSYSAVAFNKEGNLLATAGGAPDYMLTLWDWQQESVILRNKAFSQELYNVSFSPFFAGKLITSGTGHIRMWKMASTFTGLKLVGQLGKFGQVELSDVCAYVEFPDGKVLSGTESGQLLLWAGNLIKAVFRRKGHSNCHVGNVEVLALYQGGWLVVSAGQDGYIRTWDASKVCMQLFTPASCPARDFQVLELPCFTYR